MEGGSTLSPDIQNIYRMCGRKFIIIIWGAESSLVAYYVAFSFYFVLVFVLNVLIAPLGMLQIKPRNLSLEKCVFLCLMKLSMALSKLEAAKNAVSFLELIFPRKTLAIW